MSKHNPDLPEDAPANGRPASAENADARQRRLLEIQRAIADGTYETPDKLEAALEAMFSGNRGNGLAGFDE